MIAVYIFAVWMINMVITSFVNIGNDTRIPRGFIDFFKLTFLPDVLMNLKKIKED